MAAKGYCAAADVADFLAVTFTAGQTTQADNLIEQAEIFIDEETNRGWLMGAQTDEAFHHPGHYVFVRYAPVTSIDAITGRTALGEDEAALVVDEDYEMRDLEAGLIYLVYPGSYDRILVDYTPVGTVPADLKLACIELVADYMQPHLQPGSYGVESYSLPDLTVKFKARATIYSERSRMQQVFDRYRYRVYA